MLKRRIKTIVILRKIKNKEATKQEKFILLRRIFGNFSLVLSLFLMLILLLAVVVMIAGEDANSGDSDVSSDVNRQAFPESVLRWESYVRAEAEANDIPHAVDYLLVIIMLETRGE